MKRELVNWLGRLSVVALALGGAFFLMLNAWASSPGGNQPSAADNGGRHMDIAHFGAG